MANILNANEDYNPKNGLKNIFTKLVEIIKDLNANTNAIATMGNPKVYIALLSQSGTSAPVPTVLVNTLGADPIYYYDWYDDDTLGSYTGIFPSGVLVAGKTTANIDTHLKVLPGANNFSSALINADPEDNNEGNQYDNRIFNITTRSNNVMDNNLLSNTIVEIKVYP